MPITRDSFVERAKMYGAGYLLAPDPDDTTLVNLGSLSLPNALLKSGAVLSSTELLLGGKSALLDGVNDYIETLWKTRTNQVKNPVVFSNVTEWSGESLVSGPTRVTGIEDMPTELKDGSVNTAIEAAGNAASDRIYAAVAPVLGKTYRGSVWVKLKSSTGGAGIKLTIRRALLGEVQVSSPTQTKVGEWVRLDFSWVAVNIEAQRICIEQVGAGTVTFQATAFLFEESTELGSYFPTVKQVVSGEASFSGATNLSESDIGPFSRGSKRTFVGVASRDASGTPDCLIGGNGPTTMPLLVLEAGSQNVSFFAANSEVDGWAAGWPGNAQTVMWALTFDETTNVIELFINGVSKGTREHLNAYTAPGSLLLGARRNDGIDPFDGNVLPFATFLKILSPGQIQELYQYSIAPYRRHIVPDQMAVRVIAPGGSSARWADDEIDPTSIMSHLTIEDEMPGGYKQLGGTMARNPQLQWPDTETYGRLYAYLPGVEKVFEGAVDKAPQASGGERSIRVEGVGDQRFLEDDSSVVMGIIDGDLSKWGEGSTQRKIEVIGFYQTRNVESSIGFQDAGATAPSIIFRLAYNEGHPLGEMWYFSEGIPIGVVRYDFNNLAGGLEGFHDIVRIGNNDLGSGTTASSADHGNTSKSNNGLAANSVKAMYACVQSYYEGAYTGAGTDAKAWTNLRVLGAHGLTEQGTWPNIGFTAKQIHTYAIPKFAPDLKVLSSNLDDDGFIIPQAWYGTPGTLAEHIRDYTKYSLYDWFVFNDMEFQYRRPGTYGRFWKCLIGETDLDEDGLDGSRLWESIVVQFQDVGGRTITVGPPESGAMITSSSLRLTDPDHPAIKAKRTRRDLLDMSGLGTPATAIAVGERFLEEANLLPRSGSAKISGFALDSQSVLRPVSQMKSGDFVSFTDAHDKSYRKIVHRTYEHDERETDIDFDAPPGGLEQLLERLQVGLVSRGVA